MSLTPLAHWGDTAASGSTPIAGAIANAISTTDTETKQEAKGDWIDGGSDVMFGDAIRKSRRWRHGAITPTAANQNLWRAAA